MYSLAYFRGACAGFREREGSVCSNHQHFRHMLSCMHLHFYFKHTVLQAYRVDFFAVLVCVFCVFESYFLQYSSEKSQSWQECRESHLIIAVG